MPSDPTIIEEPWLEITTRTGLVMQVPAPPHRIEAIRSWMLEGLAFTSESAITKMQYIVRLSEDILFVRQFMRTSDPERMDRAKVRAQSPTGRTPSSGSSLTPSSSSARTGSPGNSSPGKSTSVTIH